MSNDEKRTTDVLNQLKFGTILVKQKINGKKYPRRFFLHEHEDFISYEESRKTFGKPRIYRIKDIDEVRSGFRSRTFDQLVRNGSISVSEEDLAFTIMYNNHRNEVHLMAPDVTTRNLWIVGVHNLIDQHAHKSQRHLITEENWILNYFREADKDRSNTLSKRECRRLLTNSLNVKVPYTVFEQLFRKADKSQEGLLSPEEFVGFFQLLTQRKDLYEIMKQYTENGRSHSIENVHMNVDELLSFLRIVQNQKLTINVKTHDGRDQIIRESIEKPEQAQELIDEFELDTGFRQKGQLSLDGFRNMLLSGDFDIVNPSHARQIYQNMTRPLCDYYINTSHNTYLFYGQLSGESNPEAYNRALLAGCRAVELDCYDGSDGKPIVTHGYTLVKPCSFESIIRYMEPNLFKTSPYPVILNIENHCSLEQQNEMARILESILGDQLLKEPLVHAANPRYLPSPEDLKYKVIVRSRKTTKATKPNIIIQSEDDDDPIFDPPSKRMQYNLGELFIFLQNVPYRDYDYAKHNYSSWHSSSLAETRFEKLSRSDPTSLILQTTWRTLRTYPGGFRQDSSNANPVTAWIHGIQMAALNFQNEDDIMPLCYGKFLDNGGCGYVLKPTYLINAHETDYNPLNPKLDLDQAKVLTLTIISAQFLSRSKTDISDIPDPYVMISIQGVPCDQKIQKTKVIENNGLDPIWNEKFSFNIKYSQLALVYFSVYDRDSFTLDDKLAYFCLPLTMMQTGYRHIHLRANNNDLTHSTLFVHVDIQDDDDDDDDNITSTRF
ncbi:unnamed protein product [Rotaria socialis]|uniref:Phosphoinositide phospholipase C n=1 Tax=Rotaria socialis TaxID=392032 RepID=A0A817USZ7_9BILA|nr:unnamed protein product [Rotaria socialis]CAF3700841.1 unnamed protein product [Rotaria socialis]